MGEMTKAQYGRLVARINVLAAQEMRSLSEGMWNPAFCSSEATLEADAFCDVVQRLLDEIRRRAALAEDNEAEVRAALRNLNDGVSE